MKKTIKFLGFALLAGALFMSCEGPAGPAGVDGVDGTDGTDGVAGNFSCLECHSSVVMDAIENQFEQTKHSEGTSFAYAGTRSDCARCHSSDAYIEFVMSGKAVAGNGTSLQCETCHDNHTVLEDSISAPLRSISEVVAVVDANKTFDHGTGNICATCHQSRVTGAAYDKYTALKTDSLKITGSSIAFYNDPANCDFGDNVTRTLNGTSDTLTIVFDIVTTDVYVSSTHAGPHHGPQANIFAGIAGYPAAGTAFTRDHHTDCASCHMSDETAGYGHSFAPDMEMCNSCHGTAVDLEGIQADVHDRLDAIVEKLAEIKMVTIDGDAPYTVDEVSPIYSIKSREEFQAFFNALCILEDKSFGVHNKVYTEQMLTVAETNLGLK